MARKITEGPLKGKTIERGIYLNDGYIYVRIYTDGIETKEYIGPETETGILDAAHEKLHEMKKLRRAGKLGQETKEVRWTVERMADAYWEEEGKKKPSHVTVYSQVRRIKELFGHEYIDACNFTHTISLREAVSKQGLKVSSVNRYHTCWRRMFYFMVEMKRAKVKGYTNVKLPEFNPGTPLKSRAETHIEDESPLCRERVVSPEEFVTFCKFADDEVKKICYLAVQTTLRRKDLKAVIEAKNDAAVVKGIQGKTKRKFEIPMKDDVRAIIAGGASFKNFRKKFEKARRDSGLPYFQYRDLRKSLPSILRQHNYDIKKISDILGHANVAMTQIYLPVADPEKRDAMADAGAAFTLPQAVNQ
jgi:hypothetical protein